MGPEMLQEMRETNRVLLEVRDLLKQQVGEKSLIPDSLGSGDSLLPVWRGQQKTESRGGLELGDKVGENPSSWEKFRGE